MMPEEEGFGLPFVLYRGVRLRGKGERGKSKQPCRSQRCCSQAPLAQAQDGYQYVCAECPPRLVSLRDLHQN